MIRILRASLGFLLLLVIPTGCAHYYLPANQLESPEAIGPGRIGSLEMVGIQAGSDLIATPTKQPTDPKTGVTPDPQLQLAPMNYVFGASVAITPELDAGLRLEPYAPPLLRVKYQLMGDPESKAKAGNFSVSVNASGGLLLTSTNGSSVTYYTALGSLIGGYRFANHHLVSLAPYFDFAGLSGVTAASESGTRYGASLGYQYDIDALILRAELTWGSGSFSESTGSVSDGGFFPGVLLGLKL